MSKNPAPIRQLPAFDLDTVNVDALRAKFSRLAAELDDVFVERREHIAGAIRALVSGTHMFMIGTPGEAKSAIIDQLIMRIAFADSDYFKLLFGSFTGPGDTFGPVDVPALKQSKEQRIVDTYLPMALVGFLDELWKANDSILNTLLPALNEREYKHGGVMYRIPLSSIFAASNELPASENLLAIYDRIAQRFVVSDIQEPANFEKMLMAELPTADEVEEFITVEDILAAKALVKQVTVSPAVATAMTEVREDLRRNHNIKASPRRYKQALNILRAEAWLQGFDEADTDVLEVLTNVLWDDPDQIDAVQTVVLAKANPLQKEIMELLSSINAIGDIVDKAVAADEDEERQSMGMEAHRKLKAAATEFGKYKDNPASSSKRNAQLLEQARDKIKTFSKSLVDNVFKIEGAGDVVI